MLDGFGLAPVCVDLDLDSYDGDWRHVARFRGRSGWLSVVEAQLRTSRHEWNTTIVAACDEFGDPVPSFMAPNLLACACSLPEPCSEYPPAVLDHIIDAERAELKRRWLREHNVTLKQLSVDTARTVEVLEAEAKHRIALREAGIADLRRRRRMPTATHEERAILTQLIEELETEQETIAETLAFARNELRSLVDRKEREILARTEIRVVVEPLYYVSWHGSSSVHGPATDLTEVVRSLSRETSYFVPSARKRDDDPDISFKATFEPVKTPSRVIVRRPTIQPKKLGPTVGECRVTCAEIGPATMPQRKSPQGIRARRAAADLWLRSSRLLRKVRSWSDTDLQRGHWLTSRFNELDRDVRRLEDSLGEAPAPHALHDAKKNLEAAAELFAARGLEFTDDL